MALINQQDPWLKQATVDSRLRWEGVQWKIFALTWREDLQLETMALLKLVLCIYCGYFFMSLQLSWSSAIYRQIDTCHVAHVYVRLSYVVIKPV